MRHVGSQFPSQGLHSGPLQRKHIIWTSGPPARAVPRPTSSRAAASPRHWKELGARCMEQEAGLERSRGQGYLSTRRASETRSPTSQPRGCPRPSPPSALPAPPAPPEPGLTCGRRRCTGKGRAGRQWLWPWWHPRRSPPCICCTAVPLCCAGSSGGKGREALRLGGAALWLPPPDVGPHWTRWGSMRVGP